MTKGNVGSLLVFDPSRLSLGDGEVKIAAQEAVVGIITERGAPPPPPLPPPSRPSSPALGQPELPLQSGPRRRPAPAPAGGASCTADCCCRLRLWSVQTSVDVEG